MEDITKYAIIIGWAFLLLSVGALLGMELCEMNQPEVAQPVYILDCNEQYATFA